MRYFTLLLMCLTVNSWAQNSENVDMLFHWSDSEIPGSWAFDNAYNEIWGYQDGANEYAIIGTTNGTHIFNVTDPASSTEIHFIEGQITGPEIIHRDYHDYEKYLYIACDEGASTLQIVDMSSLPNEVNVVYDSSDLFTRSHNIFIDEDMGVLYSCGGSSTLNLYDLSDPINPTLIIDCDDDVDFWANTVGYVHDIFVRNGIAYCNAGNGLYIVDFTDPSNPVFLGSLTDYTDSGYNHSGYLHEDGQYYALADETHGMRIKILDVSDPTDIIEVSYLWSEVDALSIAHNLIFDGDILHVSYYYDGYYAFDLSDPLNPVVIGYYDTSTIPNDNSYEGAWGVYPFLGSGNILVSDMQEGLFILDLNAVTSVESVTIHNRRPSIFPNPMSNQSEINITGLELDVNFGNYVLLDQLGKTVGSGLINFSKGNAQIELPEIGAGYYHLQVYQDNNLYNFQLVK